LVITQKMGEESLELIGSAKIKGVSFTTTPGFMIA
jgi:hypothetical protein